MVKFEQLLLILYGLGRQIKVWVQKQSPKCLIYSLPTSENKTRMGSKAMGSLRRFDGLSWFFNGKRCCFAADGISTLIANCCFLVVLSLIEAETSCAVECGVLAALFPSTRLGCFDMSVLF